jgi:hypothetical protein
MVALITFTTSVSRLWHEDVGCVAVIINVTKPSPAVFGVNIPPAVTPVPVHVLELLEGVTDRNAFKSIVPGKKQKEVSLPALTVGTGLMVTVNGVLPLLSQPVILSKEAM